MEPLLREEDSAEGPHHPGADVVTEHDGVDEFGAGRALPLRHRHRGGNDGRSRVAADDVRPVDLFAMAGRAVGQGGVRRGHPEPGPEDSRLPPTRRWLAAYRAARSPAGLRLPKHAQANSSKITCLARS